MIQGDCLEVMKDIEPNSLDSLVTDPPAGIAFMGKDWDKDKGGRGPWIAWMTEVMRECLRVLKPGAHGLVWALPRTSHWTATALEDAGFEIRDVVTHLFGTGFPKSLDVSKAIDKAAGAEREITGPKSTYRKPQEPNGWDCTKRAEFETAPSSQGAKKWQGWGTALKPASEHWILVRKPISEKTVAANVLKWGTGAINVDGCRISTGGQVVWKAPDTEKQAGSLMVYGKPGAGSDSMFKNKGGREGTSLGRFPANLVLSHSDQCQPYEIEDPFKFIANYRTVWKCAEGCAVDSLNEQSGILHPAGSAARRKTADGMFGLGHDGAENIRYPESGGASRFFYVAKASKSDRGADNKHPTVKSTKLMAYLCRLVTPPGGTILDPFAGSGSTGVAAIAEGFKFIGIEKEAQYVACAKERLNAVAG